MCHPFACSASLCIRPAHAEARRRGERAQVLQGLSDGAAPVAGNERFTRRLEAAPWGARHAVPPHPLLEVGASHDTVDPEGFNVSENCYKCTAETQSAQRFLAIARCVLCREVGED